MRLRILDHGAMHCDLTWLVLQAGLTLSTRDNPYMARQWVECPTHTVLVEHDAGFLLWDTSVPPNWETHWQKSGGQELFPYDAATTDQHLENVLKGLGVSSEQITHVCLSHLHQDHAGNLGLFKDSPAQIVCSRAEWEGATSFAGNALGAHIKQDYLNIPMTTIDEDTEIVPGVTMRMMPGHTWGTSVLQVDLPQSGTMVFTSDAIYRSENFGPPATGSAIVWDQNLWLESVEKIRVLVDETDATVVFGHDADQRRQLQFAPHVYE